jgi:arginyl-tRNA synthetase
VYQTLTNRLREALAGHIREKYAVELAIVLERPPKIEMGEAASPVCFELAKRLKKAPRQIAQEIANGLGRVDGIAKVEAAGGGYLNAFFDRAAFWTGAQKEQSGKWRVASGGSRDSKDEIRLSESGGTAPDRAQRDFNTEGTENTKKKKIIVEHTSINPNKAAHIGHVRNAVLGDTMVRILRHTGNRVQIQNYIDNTGVQVADVVIGLLQMEKVTPVWVKNRAAEAKFDYYCWDLYAKATSFFAQDKARAAKLREETLKSIEEGKGEEAEVGQVVADAIVGCHLRTMARLDIGYELLARESEILHLKFWDAAFEMLKKSGAIQLATSGKMAGCWIMPWKEEEKAGINTEGTENAEDTEKTEEEENSQDKIIVRSNGTVTYVGKDIAYQLWKFGLLGKDFHYRKWPNAPEGQTVWSTTSGANDPEAPHFGEPASSVYNVIDARQAYLQKVVAAGLRALGHVEAAERSIHLSYEIVALTPRCAAEMGYELTPEEAKKPYVEVSGRKGFGVKADDLIEKLEAAALDEVQARHPANFEGFALNLWTTEEQWQTAHAIAIGALRFYLLKFTRNAVIAFDFKDALSFEGETGPYCQYAVVRARGIWRRGAEISPELTSEANIAEAARILELSRPEAARKFLDGSENSDLWELSLLAGSLDYAVEAAITTQEPAFVAKYAFQLAQAFNNFYHKHHILSETDERQRAFLLRLTELVEAQLVRALSLMGISAPEKM